MQFKLFEESVEVRHLTKRMRSCCLYVKNIMIVKGVEFRRIDNTDIEKQKRAARRIPRPLSASCKGECIFKIRKVDKNRNLCFYGQNIVIESDRVRQKREIKLVEISGAY